MEKEKETSEKDLVCVPDEEFSVEIKTSSHKSKIFGNRSYSKREKTKKKGKSGITFDKF